MKTQTDKHTDSSSASVASDSPNQSNETRAVPSDVMIKPGFGYWDCTVYPIGGDFHRVGQLAMLVKLTGPIGDYGKGCNAIGITANNRTVCFDINYTIKVNA